MTAAAAALHELLALSAARRPDAEAILFRERRWSYREMEALTAKVAAGFSREGIRKGDRVALLLKNSPEFVLSIFALSRLGAAAVPVNIYLTREEVAAICAHAEVKAAVTQPGFLATMLAAAKDVPGLARIWLADSQDTGGDSPLLRRFDSLTEGEPPAAPPVEKADPILIVYTSGTTGTPKGAMLSHSNLLGNAQSCILALELEPEDRFICILPLFHVFAFTANLLVPLMLGASVLLIESIRPPTLWLRCIARRRITIFAAVPQVFALMAEQARGLKRWILRFHFFRSVRLCISGAAPLRTEVLEKFEKRIGAPLLEGYGLTETSPVVSVNTLAARRAGSVGRPLPGVDVRIVDPEEKELPRGEEGEICLSGSNVMMGYYRMPEETEKAFCRNGELGRGRFFKTGDSGYIDADGFLRIQDRLKDMIIVKGLKVFSIQIENLLLSHPAVQEAAVIGVPGATGDETIRAYVSPKPGFTIDKAELHALCREKLPPYKRPRDIEVRPELPKNALQKILKRELRRAAMREKGNSKTI